VHYAYAPVHSRQHVGAHKVERGKCRSSGS